MDKATLQAEINWIKNQCRSEDHYIWRALTGREPIDNLAEKRFEMLIKRAFALMDIASEIDVRRTIANSLSKIYLRGNDFTNAQRILDCISINRDQKLGTRDFNRFKDPSFSSERVNELKRRLLDTNTLDNCIKEYYRQPIKQAQKSTSDIKENYRAIADIKITNDDKIYSSSINDKIYGNSFVHKMAAMPAVLQSEASAENVNPPTNDQTDQTRKYPTSWLNQANIFVKYWRGDIPLITSYWVISLIVTIASYAITNALRSIISVDRRFNPKLILLSELLVWFIVLSLVIWQLVGLWRSAVKYNSVSTNKRAWGSLARIMVFFGWLRVIQSVVNVAYPEFRELVPVALGADTAIPDYRIMVLEYPDNVREIKIEGGFKHGLYEDLVMKLNENPSIKTIELDSIGGRIGEAADVYHLLNQRHLNTVVNAQCLSACTIAFAGGENRWLGIEGKLGFHSAAFANLPQNEANFAYSEIHNEISITKNIPTSFFVKSMTFSNDDMWYPNTAELIKANYLTSTHSQASSSALSIHTKLEALATEENQKLPKVIDQNYTLDHLSSDEQILTFVYVIKDSSYLRNIIELDKQGKWVSGEQKAFCSKYENYIQNGAVLRAMYILNTDDKWATHYVDISSCVS